MGGGLGGSVGSLNLSVRDYLDAHQVPLSHRPRWIRQLVAMERVFQAHVAATLKAKEPADG